MLCPIIIIALSLALIVLLGGLFLLAYAKKESLGKMTKIASYVAILFGTVVFVGGIICATMCSTCHKGKCTKDKMECSRGGMKGECSKGSSCDKEEECSEIVIESNDGEKIIKHVKIIKTK